MLKVYIASPYTLRNSLTNVNTQIRVANELRTKDDRILPFWPLHSHFWDQRYPHDYEFWMKLCEEWVNEMDCILRLPGDSKGADREVALARELCIPVFYTIQQVLTFSEVHHA